MLRVSLKFYQAAPALWKTSQSKMSKTTFSSSKNQEKTDCSQKVPLILKKRVARTLKHLRREKLANAIAERLHRKSYWSEQETTLGHGLALLCHPSSQTTSILPLKPNRDLINRSSANRLKSSLRYLKSNAEKALSTSFTAVSFRQKTIKLLMHHQRALESSHGSINHRSLQQIFCIRCKALNTRRITSERLWFVLPPPLPSLLVVPNPSSAQLALAPSHLSDWGLKFFTIGSKRKQIHSRYNQLINSIKNLYNNLTLYHRSIKSRTRFYLLKVTSHPQMESSFRLTIAKKKAVIL